MTIRLVRDIALLSIACSMPLSGQMPAEVTLAPAARFAEPFSRIRGIRELPDGRLFIIDQREKALYLVDFDAGTRVKVGSNGAGPEEYDEPTGLYPFRGDSSLMVDMSNGRLAIFGVDGRIAWTEPMARPGTSIPIGVDRHGNLYWDHVIAVRLAKRENPSADQAPIARFNRATGAIDTLAFLTVPGPVNPGAFPAWDLWTVSRDGRIAIVRNQDEYRVDWVEPDRRITRGTPVPFQAIRVSSADREAVRQRPGGGRAAGVASRGGPPRQPPMLEIPDRFPAAKQRGAWVSVDGRLFVERHQHLDELRPLFDVFDARGRLAARYRLPEGRSVIGFGARGLYAVRVDDVGLMWIERYDIG